MRKLPLSEAGHRLDLGATRLEGARSKLPPISYIRRHLRSGRIVRFEGWLGRIGHGGERPELDYIHVLLPRAPRECLPDGSHYVEGRRRTAGRSCPSRTSSARSCSSGTPIAYSGAWSRA